MRTFYRKLLLAISWLVPSIAPNEAARADVLASPKELAEGCIYLLVPAMVMALLWHSAYAEDLYGPVVAHQMPPLINAADMKWDAAPKALPPGAQLAVISGDPFKDGLYVVRLKMPAGYKIPAHNHPTTEYVTVISGEVHLGMGNKLDPRKSIALTTSGFAEAPAKMNHYAWAARESVIQVHGQGPFAITYVNPADDPSMQ